MRSLSGLLIHLAGCALTAVLAMAQTRLPNGWTISPVGRHIRLSGDFPSRIIHTANGRYLLVLTCGYHDQGVRIIDTKSQQVISSANLGKAYGDLAMNDSSNELFIAAGGPVGSRFWQRLISRGEQPIQHDFHAAVLRAGIREGRLFLQPPLQTAGSGERPVYASSVCVGRDGTLFVVDINNDKLYRLSPPEYKIDATANTGYGPYRAVLSPNGVFVAVSNWGDESVDVFSSKTLARAGHVRVGIHPNDLTFGADGRLFVANAGSNSVSIVTGTRVTETIKTSLHPFDPVGSTPDAVAIDPTEKWLFIANAGNNNIAVVDISELDHSQVQGFIPTGWYPSALNLSPDGKVLYVGIAKGLGSRANVPTMSSRPRQDYGHAPSYDYVGETLTGYVSIVPIPGSRELKQLTTQVMDNTPQTERKELESRAARIRTQIFPKIRHVLYIIRENRTYDQVLGDLGKGNGDPSLTLFGEKITPNAHCIARAWVLLDNLFVDGDVSEDGHQWSDGAYSSQFTSQAWLQSYSGRSEPKASESELGADERLRSSPAGYLWDNCARHGLSFRTYGEFAYYHAGPDDGPRFVAKGLEGHASIVWLKLASAGWRDIARGRDPDLAEVFVRELQQAEVSGEWPKFMVMSLGEDHTHALRPGHFTPSAMVASNDQALGKIVAAVSRSRFWPETAIFVIEDDAQDGPDHVDCRRTVGFVISPYSRRGAVDSTAYSTASMIHTMEKILGLPPMTQFDRGAPVMYNSFTEVADLGVYQNIPPQVDLFAKNPAKGPGAEASLKLDFSAFDRADPQAMNRILWNSLKPGVPMPPPVRSAAVDIVRR